MLIDIMNDHGLEQLVHFPTREKNTLDLILTSLPGQFQEIYSPDKLSDHDVVSGTLKVYVPPPKRNLGGRCIYITKEILSKVAKMPANMHIFHATGIYWHLWQIWWHIW